METNLECGGRIIAPCGIIRRVMTCRKMGAADVQDAFQMLSDFLREDEHYLASSQAYGDLGLAGLNNALDLFLERSELGFVWCVTPSRPRWGRWLQNSTMSQ